VINAVCNKRTKTVVRNFRLSICDAVLNPRIFTRKQWKVNGNGYIWEIIYTNFYKHSFIPNYHVLKLHGYIVHQQYWTLFYYQLMHTMLKNAELLKHSKLDKNAPTCFGLHRNHLTKRVIFSQALTLAPWRWFLCKPKHVGAFLSNLECFNNSSFFNIVCIGW